MMETNVVINGDCQEVMAEMGDGCVAIIITDPPYGINADKMQSNRAGKSGKSSFAHSTDYGKSDWDSFAIDAHCISLMSRISDHQIIFGANYICDILIPNTQWLFWDKETGSNTYADGELIWTSFHGSLRKFSYMWKGMFQGDMKNKELRVHPTQKPLPLMSWIIDKYTKPNDIILDPFCGSGSTLVAAKNLGRRYIGIELELKYCEIAETRLAQHTLNL
jgi:site-specific DNA-methyltransferase (adenine-specific)